MLAGAIPDTAGSQDAYHAQRARLLAEIAGMARATGAETSRPAFSPRVMAAVGRVRAPPVWCRPGRSRTRTRTGRSHRARPDDLAALHRRADDRSARSQAGRHGARNRHRLGVPGRGARGARGEGVHDRDRRPGREAGGGAIWRALGYRNVATRIGDGYNGWAEAAPFDGILVTAAAPYVPKPLVEQLKPGGRLVIPVGGQWQVQELQVIEKKPDGSTVTRRTIPVRFVPLTRSK